MKRQHENLQQRAWMIGMRRRNTRRTISSTDTFYVKYVIPCVWIGLYGLGTCCLWLGLFHDRNGAQPPVALKCGTLASWVIVSGILLWFCGRIKRVQIDDDALYVSNYWSEVRIPYAEVNHISQSYMSGPMTITIHLRENSAFGDRVVFRPQCRWNMYVSGTHPTVIELQAKCESAKERGEISRPTVRFDPLDRPGMRFVEAMCRFSLPVKRSFSGHRHPVDLRGRPRGDCKHRFNFYSAI